MRFAIVSDIHGNEVALHSVVDDIDSTGIDQVYAAGDLALLGPRRVNVWRSCKSEAGAASGATPIG